MLKPPLLDGGFQVSVPLCTSHSEVAAQRAGSAWKLTTTRPLARTPPL